MLVHGAPDRSKNFAHVVHQLHDLPVTVYDRRGYGRSLAAGASGGGFETHAEDLLALLDGTPSVVVGQSAGGAIAMMAATKAPELFAALGAWEPPMVPWDWWMGDESRQLTIALGSTTDPAQLAEDFNRRIFGDERWELLRDGTKELLRAEGVAFRTDMRSQYDPFFEPADLAHLAVPFIVGCGTVAPDRRYLDAHRRTAEHTGGELFVAEGADHSAHLNQPSAWIELVRRTVALAHSR